MLVSLYFCSDFGIQIYFRIGNNINNDRGCQRKFVEEFIIKIKVKSLYRGIGLYVRVFPHQCPVFRRCIINPQHSRTNLQASNSNIAAPARQLVALQMVSSNFRATNIFRNGILIEKHSISQIRYYFRFSICVRSHECRGSGIRIQCDHACNNSLEKRSPGERESRKNARSEKI